MQRNTKESRSFDDWLADCSEWWDMTTGDEVFDFPDLPWQAWYEEGLTVEAAVKRANFHVYGWREE